MRPGEGGGSEESQEEWSGGVGRVERVVLVYNMYE